MKVLFICALIVAGGFVVKGAHELCGLNDDQIQAVVKCMGERVDSQLQAKAREFIRGQGGNVAQLLKKQCDAGVDFSAAVTAVLSPEQAEAVRNAYKECRAAQS
ncbi:uncharacterized protein LOC144123081 [Amblyomma americanum]